MELKHLAAYLPYGLEIYDNVHKFSFNLSEKWANELPIEFQPTFGKNILTQVLLDDTLKPCLRQLSNLTKEIEHNGEKFVPIDTIGEKVNDFCDLDFVTDWSDRGGNFLEYLDEFIQRKDNHHHLDFLPFGFIQKLLEWKFDIFSLIEKGEAIDINTLDL